MRDRIVMTMGLVAVAVVLWLLVYTTPFGIGPFGVLVFFTMVYMVLFSLVIVAQLIFKKITDKSMRVSNKGYLYATVISFSGMLIMLTNTFQGSWMVAVLVGVLFGVLGCFLVSKRF